MLPNMVLTAPAEETEVRLALEFALAQDKPVVIRYPRGPGSAAGVCQSRLCRAIQAGKERGCQKG